jgi:hypothetical protein
MIVANPVNLPSGLSPDFRRTGKSKKQKSKTVKL